jgi:hypothetical protein
MPSLSGTCYLCINAIFCSMGANGANPEFRLATMR